MISYNSQSDVNKNLLNTRTINEIDIMIYDENNNLINFNNLDWNITLIITTEIKFDQQEVSLNTLLKYMTNNNNQIHNIYYYYFFIKL